MEIKWKHLFCIAVALSAWVPISATPVDTATINKWNQRALDMAYSEPKEGLKIAREAAKGAEKIGYHYGHIRALIRIGIISDVMSRFTEAVGAYNEALDLATKTKDQKAIASISNNLGLIYWNNAKLDSAYASFSKAYYAFCDLKDDPASARAANNLGLLYDEMERPRNALHMYHLALKHSGSPDGELAMGVYANMGLAYLSLQKLDSARHFLETAVSGFRRFGNDYALGTSLSDLALVYKEQEQVNKAIPAFLESMQIAEKLGNERSYISSGFNLAGCYRRKKQYEKQLPLLQDIYTRARVLESEELLSKICLELAIVYYRFGEIDSAEQKMFEFDKSRSSYEKEQYSERLAKAEKKFETEEARRRIAELQNSKLQAELKLTAKNNQLLFLLIFILGGGLSSILMVQRYRGKKKREYDRALLLERDRGVAAIIDAQEEERTRVARELHDGVGNKLLALKMRMTSLVNAEGIAEQQPGQATDMLLDVMDEVRNVSHKMMPRTLEDFGCVPAIEDMLERTFQYSGIRYSCETHNLRERYEPRIEIALYRVTQELVSNIIKHAAATEVFVQLVETANRIVLFVEDNGKGIHASNPSADGIGLSSVKSRINALNGSFSISPGEVNGTVVTIKIPLDDKKEI